MDTKWMGGWMGGKASLRIAYSNQQRKFDDQEILIKTSVKILFKLNY